MPNQETNLENALRMISAPKLMRRKKELIPSGAFKAIMIGLLSLTALAAQSQDLRLMPLGDSITSGFRSSDNNGYRGALQNQLATAVTSLDFAGSIRDGSMRDPQHQGHSGWRIDQVAGIATGALQAYRPNVVTLHIGTNDMGQNYDVGGAPNRLAALIDQTFNAAPDATVIVATLINSGDSAIESRILAYNSTIPGIVQARANAGKHILMVDMSSVTSTDLYPGDPLHPSDSGYRKMAGIWNDGVKRAIAAGWVKGPVPMAAHIVGDQSKSCLDVTGASRTNNTAVLLWGCAGGAANQLWTRQPNGTVSVYGGQCLDVLSQSTAPGTTVGIYGCNGGANQQWKFDTDGSIVGVQSGLCIDVNANAVANGSKVTLWTCNGGPNQKWMLSN